MEIAIFKHRRQSGVAIKHNSVRQNKRSRLSYLTVVKRWLRLCTVVSLRRVQVSAWGQSPSPLVWRHHMRHIVVWCRRTAVLEQATCFTAVMWFNSKKYYISRQRNKSSPIFYLGTDLLSTVSSHTYLGITVSSDLNGMNIFLRQLGLLTLLGVIHIVVLSKLKI